MKFLAFSDTHSANYKAFSKYIDGRNSRLLTILKCIEEIQKLGVQENVDFYLFGGDVFHTLGYVENDVFNLTFDAFKKFSKPLICIPGNHDTFKSSNASDISFQKFSEIKDVFVKPYEIMLSYGLACIGYNPNQTTEELLSLVKEHPRARILAIHQTPKGCVLNDYTFEEGIDWKQLEPYVDLILFGHIHQPMQLSTKSFVLGAPLHHNFSDQGERGVWIFDLENGLKTNKFVGLNFPKFFTINKITDEVRKDKFNYYRVLDAESNVAGLDNVVATEKIDSLDSAFVNRNVITSGMTIDAIVDKYLDLKLQDKNRIGQFKKYGIEQLTKADSQCLSITPSNFRAQSIEIEGFLSFKEKAELVFKDGVWLVLGVGEGFTSNGAGKSSLFDAIFWCLYGETTKKLSGDDVINDDLGKDCMVSLTLWDSSSDTHMVVQRYRKYGKQGTGLSVSVNGVPIEGAPSIVEKKLIGMLGFDYDFFLNTVYYSQEKTEFFASSTDSVRKSFLDSVLQTEKYGIALKAVKGDVEKYEKIRSQLEQRKVFIQEEIRRKEANIVEIQKNEEAFEEDRRKSQKRLAVLIEEFKDGLNKVQSDQTSSRDSLDVKEKTLEALNEGMGNLRVETELGKGHLTSRSSKLWGEMHSLEKERNKHVSKAQRVASVQDNVVCDYCGSFITVESRQKYIDQENQEVAKLEEEIAGKRKKVVVLDEELAILLDKSDAEQLKYQKATSELKVEIATLKSNIWIEENKFRELSSKLTSCQKDLDRCTEEENPYTLEIADKRKEIQDDRLSIKQTDALIEQGIEEAEVVQFWEEGFSNAGIKSLLFDEFCSLFNTEINKSIGLLSNGNISVGLSPTSKLKSGDLREKLELKVLILGREKSYNHLSGGEKRRVDIATMITLNKIIRNMYNVESGLLGLLILDEIFSFLDDTGEENVYYILQEAAKEIRSIYVITHTDELKSFFEKYIVVQKLQRCSFLAEKTS